MRVLHVTTHLNAGGISSYILSLSAALKRCGAECIVASSGGGMESEFRMAGVETITLDIKTKNEFSPKVLRAVFRLAGIIRRLSVDIVHAHTRVAQAASFFSGRLTGIPVVTTCHGFFKRRLSRRLFDYWGDRTIAISRPVMKSLMDDFTVEGGRIALVHSGVDTEKFSRRYSDKEVSDLRRQSGLPPDRPVIGAIGRLSPVKGHPVFIEAVRRVSGSGRSVQGLLVGSGPEEGALRRLVKEKGMEDSFRFLKSDPDTARYLAMMDIFVFPSFREGLGLGLLEAMAAGRPCVASNVGGISDIVMDGETGLLFPAGDAAALSSLILRLLDDRGLCERLGASAGVFVRNNFSVGTMADRILNIYKEVRQSVCA